MTTDDDLKYIRILEAEREDAALNAPPYEEPDQQPLQRDYPATIHEVAPQGAGPQHDNPALHMPHYSYPAPLQVDITETWPEVGLPKSLFDLEIRDDMLPDQGFITAYLKWAEPTTDAPRSIHLATCLSVLGSSAMPNWTVRGAMVAHLNLLILIIADAATRKSTGMNRGKGLISESRLNTIVSSSLADFIQQLSSKPTQLWCLDEADPFFHMLQAGHSDKAAAVLASGYYRQQMSNSALSSGTTTVDNPCFSILTGAAFDWLQARKLSPELLRGGLFSRFMIIPAQRTRLELYPPKANEEAAEVFRKWLLKLQMTGPFELQLSPQAKTLFMSYQVGRGETTNKNLTSGIWDRAPEHVVKLAALYHISLYRSGRSPIEEDCMRWAINMVHYYLLPGHLWVCAKLEATTDRTKACERAIQEALEAAGTAGRAYAPFSAEFGNRVQFNGAVVNMYRRGLLSFWAVKTNEGRGRSMTMIVLGTAPPAGVRVLRAMTPKFVAQAAEKDGFELDELQAQMAELNQQMPAAPEMSSSTAPESEPLVYDYAGDLEDAPYTDTFEYAYEPPPDFFPEDPNEHE